MSKAKVNNETPTETIAKIADTASHLDAKGRRNVRRGRASTEAGGEGGRRRNGFEDEQAEGPGRKMKAEKQLPPEHRDREPRVT